MAATLHEESTGMPLDHEGSGDGRIAVAASWVILAVIVVQSTASMSLQVTDDLTAVNRVVGILCALGSAGLFTWLQLRVIRASAVPTWMPWTIALLTTVGLTMGVWLPSGLLFAIFALMLRGWRFLAACIVYAAALPAYIYAQDVRLINAAFYVLVLVVIGLLLYALTRLAVTVSELARARETVARLHVDEERHRISRDLHDILGRSLVAVSLRVQTALRLLERDPARCGEQLEEIERMVTVGQSQLRGLTRGETVVGIFDELSSAREIFARLDIQSTCDITTAEESMDEIVDGFGARVLRECVTNLLKHSRPTWVEISLRDESSGRVLVIVNDGAGESETRRGTGLTDLAARAESLGGSLDAGHLPSGRFRILARMPYAPTPTDTEPTPLETRS